MSAAPRMSSGPRTCSTREPGMHITAIRNETPLATAANQNASEALPCSAMKPVIG